MDDSDWTAQDRNSNWDVTDTRVHMKRQRRQRERNNYSTALWQAQIESEPRWIETKFTSVCFSCSAEISVSLRLNDILYILCSVTLHLSICPSTTAAAICDLDQKPSWSADCREDFHGLRSGTNCRPHQSKFMSLTNDKGYLQGAFSWFERRRSLGGQGVELVEKYLKQFKMTMKREKRWVKVKNVSLVW